MKRGAEYLDRFIFVKKGYSLWKHLVPFSIAALLLLTLSVPQDNLLLKLAGLLQRLSWTLLPATLLTFVATFVYFQTLGAQIRRAYLWPDHDLRRTIFTFFFYVVLCAVMAFAVLQSASPDTAAGQDITWGNVWACFLIAVLSLTGIGWSGPSSWAESVGRAAPDYTEGRSSAQKLSEILRDLRQKPEGDPQDLGCFVEATEGLRSDIDKNIELEPEWTERDLRHIEGALSILTQQATAWAENPDTVRDFAAICKCQRRDEHADFTKALVELGRHRLEWQWGECRSENSEVAWTS